MRTGALAFVVLAACGNGEDRSGFDATTNGSADTFEYVECGDSSKLIWTIEANKRLAKFDPMTGDFQTVGTLQCPGSNAFFQPFSMVVDRNAIAWVLYDDYSNPNVAPVLFRVDTSTLACTATTWATQNGIRVFGMGYSTDAVGGSDDTLFIAGGTDTDATTSTLATLSTTTFQASVVGSMGGWAELTGNANAELWAFLPKNATPSLQQINKSTGATLQTLDLASLAGAPDAWAFASWGGDFWVFHKRTSDPATVIYHVDGTTGAIIDSIHTISVGTPRTVVGAGVSTCAPVMLQ